MPSYFCRICKRPLSDPKSIEKGIGPICEKFYAWANEAGLFDNPNQIYDIPFDKNTGDIICRREKDFECHFNIPQRIIKHSPTGMEWGYGGSGPADFALNILSNFVSEEKAREVYQDFKFKYVAGLPRKGGVIKGKDIIDFLSEKGLL